MPFGPLPPGDVGYYTVDWSEQLAAVAGDTITGAMTVECASPDLSITNVMLNGSAVAFNVTSEVAATYLLTARASFMPSGRRLSQRIEMIVGEEPSIEPISLDEARRHLRLDASGNPAAHPEDDLVSSLITAARQYCEGETGLTIVTTKLTDYRDSWDNFSDPIRHGWGYPHFGGSGFGAGATVAQTMRPSFLLLHAPVISIDEVRYIDPAGVMTVLAPDQYRRVPFAGVMARLEPAVGEVWPAAYYGAHGAVQVEYTAGFTGPIEEGLKAAIKLVLGAYYENRGTFEKDAMVPSAVSDILDGYRVL